MQQVVDTKRVQRIKSTKDSIFRSSLFVILSLIVTLLFSLILMIVVKGTQGLNSDSVMIKDFLFGNYYNPTGGFFVGGVLIFNSI
ncbi:MAG: hypothetical protein DRQ78_01310 [Epsilonproteobacteria bacterium]|nr:MAG: hypothetical protein DRQ78_01310 [Campylobacterota bacterium]